MALNEINTGDLTVCEHYLPQSSWPGYPRCLKAAGDGIYYFTNNTSIEICTQETLQLEPKCKIIISRSDFLSCLSSPRQAFCNFDPYKIIEIKEPLSLQHRFLVRP